MPIEQIRLGIVGCGLIVRNVHARDLLRMPEAQVVGLCDPDRASLDLIMNAHPSLKNVPAFSDYRELLDKVPMDGVLISTPHTFHFPQIGEALERRLHVLSEKPLVVRSDHARKLIELRDKHRRVLLVAYQRHYQSGYRYLRKAVSDGRLGRLNMIVGHQSENWLTANASRWRTDPALSGGGVMADVMSHILEALLWITDLQPEEVYARFDNRGTRVEVIAALSIRFAGGAIASISTGGDTRRARFHEEISLCGDSGALQLVWEAGPAVTEWAPEKRVVPESEWPPASSPTRNFANAILGKEEIEVPAEWALKVTLLKEAAWESGRTGRPVKVMGV